MSGMSFLLSSAYVHVAFSKIDFQKFSFQKTRGQTVDTLGLSPQRKPNDEKTRALNARESETSSNETQENPKSFNLGPKS